MFKLMVRSPDGTSRELRLDSPCRVGRAPDNDLTLAGAGLSRHHAVFIPGNNTVEVRDLGSKNGTWVGEQRVKSHILAPGDDVRLGALVVEVLGSTGRLHPVGGAVVTSSGGPSEGRTWLGDVDSADLRRALRSTDRTQAKLEVLLEAGQLLAEPGDTDTVLDRVVDLAFRILEVDVGCVLVDEDGTLSAHVRRERLPGLSRHSPWSRHVADWVQEKGEAALYRDALRDVRLENAASVMLGKIRAAMGAPLRGRDATFGVLYVDSRTRSNAFDEEDLAFLSAFATQAGIALEHAAIQRQLREEAVARRTLQRFFPPQVADKVLSSPEALGVVEATVTAMFADISGFTAMSSAMRPTEVLALLNVYFPRVSDVVLAHGGTLEKYIGDALLGVWGAPFENPDDADQALHAAIALRAAASTVSRPDGSPMVVHIGLSTGLVAAGALGTDAYVQYATIGDTTNVAARACGVATEGQIVITEATRAALREAWPLVELGQVSLRGKELPMALYSVSGSPPATDAGG
ncbi:MAG: adenylate cyclase [Myxococcota bacterium]|jgi:adenylate cyclase